MLSDCLYSSNKRAKNCRDKEREYRRKKYDKYSSEEKYREKKQYYYSQKETMLSLLTPVCIHREMIYERERIYDYEIEYYDSRNKFVYENGYFDHDLQEYVCFGDVEVPKYHYYLFYDLNNYSFHSPIDEKNVDEFRNKYDIDVIDVDRIITNGCNINNLLSNQFVEKVIDVIKSGNYVFVKEL